MQKFLHSRKPCVLGTKWWTVLVLVSGDHCPRKPVWYEFVFTIWLFFCFVRFFPTVKAFSIKLWKRKILFDFCWKWAGLETSRCQNCTRLTVPPGLSFCHTLTWWSHYIFWYHHLFLHVMLSFPLNMSTVLNHLVESTRHSTNMNQPFGLGKPGEFLGNWGGADPWIPVAKKKLLLLKKCSCHQLHEEETKFSVTIETTKGSPVT